MCTFQERLDRRLRRRRSPTPSCDRQPLDRHDAVAARAAARRPSWPRGNLAGSSSSSGGMPAACVPAIRNVRRPARQACDAKAMPSIVTRSNGGWSRSARTDCASTAPGSEASGRDSIGSGRTRSPHQRLGLGGCRQCSAAACHGSAAARRRPRRALLAGLLVPENAFFSAFQRSTKACSSSRAELCFLAWIASIAAFFGRVFRIHVVERGDGVGLLLVEAGQVGLLDALDVFLDARPAPSSISSLVALAPFGNDCGACG